MDADPWDWPVDELVARTCSSSDFYSGHASPSRGTLSALETFLRNKAITGKEFLTNNNPRMLEYISQVEPPFQRVLLDVIRLLRSRSLLYQQQYATRGVESINIGSKSTPVQLHPTPESSNHRKRRKVSHLTTLPLSLVNEPTEALKNAGHRELMLYNGGTYEDLGRRWEQNENPDDIAGDDEAEEDAEESSEPDEDMDEEIDHAPEIYARTGKLSCDKVVDIINEMIDQFTQQSRPEDNEVEADKPPEHYENRLDLIADDILSLHHTSVEGVRFQCRSLEGTVDLLEKAKWRASIIEPAVSDAINGSSDTHHRSVEVIDCESFSLPDMEEESPDEMLVTRETKGTSLIGVQQPDRAMTPKSRRSRSPSIVELSARSLRRTGPIRNADRPDLASWYTISLYDWGTIETKKDRKRIVQKVMQEMNLGDLENLRTRIDSLTMQNLFMEVRNCIDMFLRGEERLQGVLKEDLPKIKSFTCLFLSWWLAGNYSKKVPGLLHLRELQKLSMEASPVLYDNMRIFYYWVQWTLSNNFSVEALKREYSSRQAEYIIIPDDD